MIVFSCYVFPDLYLVCFLNWWDCFCIVPWRLYMKVIRDKKFAGHCMKIYHISQ
jgi:hypothetical protein